MAHKKGGGSDRNGRDSVSKRLGVKRFGRESVTAGSILVRQRGTKFVAGRNVGTGRDWTLFTLIDEVKIFARAGHGGKGCVAFLRETFRPKGGPSGGNGGHGGNVILQADHDLNNLIAQYYQARLLAQNGENGMGKGMDGRAGKDLIVKVPCGTLV